MRSTASSPKCEEARLQHRTPREIEELHLRAGRWLECNDDVEAAMRHYLAGDHGEAIRLMEEKHLAILTRGGLGTLLGWAAQLPEGEAARDPSACVTLGTVYGWAGKAAEAERRFAKADALFAADGAVGSSPHGLSLQGRAAAMRSFIADVAGQTARAIELARLADKLLGPEEIMLRSLIPYIMGKAYRYQGYLRQVETYSRQRPPWRT